jgi:uncharacterized protein YcfJ
MKASGTFQRLVCVVAAASLWVSVSGCQTTAFMASDAGAKSAQGISLTAAEMQMRQDAEQFDKTVIGGVATGAMIGATLGALATVLSGGDSRQVAQSAAFGALAGGVLGGVDGYVTAKKQQSGRDEIRALQATAADLRKDNEKLQAFIASSDNVLAEGKLRLAVLRVSVADKKLSTQQADQARQREEQNIKSMDNALVVAKKTREQYAQAAVQLGNSPQARRDLDSEIARMDKQVLALESNIKEYNRALAVSKA